MKRFFYHHSTRNIKKYTNKRKCKRFEYFIYVLSIIKEGGDIIDFANELDNNEHSHQDFVYEISHENC